MDNRQFKLTYLPIFYDDLAEAADYISVKLKNPESAKKLIDLTEQAILNRPDNPTCFQPIQTKKQRKHPYYRIIVRNCSVYYVVIDNVMEVRRFYLADETSVSCSKNPVGSKLYRVYASVLPHL